MLILLPPSETKRDGGDGPPLAVHALSFPPLHPTRNRLVSALESLSRSVDQSARVLQISGRLAEVEAGRNADLRTAATMPALERYTGVLYDALGADSLTKLQRSRASERIVIASALFGLVRADDQIPAYRLSGANKLPRLGGLPAIWRPVLEPVLNELGEDQLVVDLRSGAYSALAPRINAVSVNVLSERPDGTRSVVSHANKQVKGLFAALLIKTRSEPSSAADIAKVARRGGLIIERTGKTHIDIIVGT